MFYASDTSHPSSPKSDSAIRADSLKRTTKRIAPQKEGVLETEESLAGCLRSPSATSKRKASDRGYDDIEKEDTYNVIHTLAPSNQCKTELCNNYDWYEDDDDIFASISTQEILHQDVKVNNNFPHTSTLPVNKQITQGNQRDNISGYSKSLVLRETNVAFLQKASGERTKLEEDKNAVRVSVISIKNESEEVKSKVNRDEVGKVNNPESSLVSAGFQTANGKKISTHIHIATYPYKIF
ncbi:uncharacterized protein ACN427_013580 [Glossina fuscipes fuscipes]